MPTSCGSPVIGLSIAEAGRPPSSRLLTGFIALELSRTPTLSPAAGVPEANRLAEANSFSDSGKVLRQTRGGVAVAWSAVWCQIGAYELAVAYAVKRGQFGRPIGHCQLMQDLLVRMLGNITASLGLVVRVAQLQEDGVFRDEHAALAKAYTTSRLRETVAWASEPFGSNGNLVDHGIARFFADAEALYSYEGSREVNHLIVGRSITGKGAFV